MITLTITPCGTVDAARSQHDTVAAAYDALALRARGYQIHDRGNMSGTLTTRCGRVNQASYTWYMRGTDNTPKAV